MTQKSKTIDRCQISGTKDLKTILSLGYLPPVNKLKNNPPDYPLLFSWHIASELKHNLKKKSYRGKFIIPMSYPRVIN
tara:strand:- start:378 stop:611 length:234 start_codon:yes stop_codon:yes gene_type:complete